MDVTHALWRKHRLKCLNRNPDAPVLTWCDAPLIMPNCGKFIQPCFYLTFKLYPYYSSIIYAKSQYPHPVVKRSLIKQIWGTFLSVCYGHWPVMPLLFCNNQNESTLDYGSWYELLSSLLFSSSSQLRLKKLCSLAFLVMNTYAN